MASDECEQATSSAAEIDDDDPVSMVDVLKQEEQLEEEACAVLGASDDQHCTYPDGYKKRQALYACHTCSAADKTKAGVCLACSYACHEGHDLYELYTKRNFRCDCGNKKFPTLTCKLYPEKDDFNTDNRYNQNFDGLYCVCSRPYPDPEDEVEDEMIQCVICEDWYHGRHLGTSVPANGDYHEMICTGCMSRHSFLWSYSVQSKEHQTVKEGDTSENVDVETVKKVTSVHEKPPERQTEEKPVKSEEAEASAAPCDTEKTDDVVGSCILKDLQQREVSIKDCATFWPDGWRTKLCRCTECTALYSTEGLEFLPEQSDTVLEYEQQGKGTLSSTSQQDRELQALQGMGRIQQIEMVQGFNDMKSALSDYLKKFAENGKVVRAEDIQEFFSQMQARKKQKTGPSSQFFCR